MESKGDERMKKNIIMNIATQIYSINIQYGVLG